MRALKLLAVLASLVGATLAAVPPTGAQQPITADPGASALAYIQEHRKDFGLTEADVRELVVSDVVPISGAGHAVTVQQFKDGLQIIGARATLAVTVGGDVIPAPNRFVEVPPASAIRRSTAIDAVEAATAAASSVGLKPVEPISQAVQQRNAAPGAPVVLTDGGISLAPLTASEVWSAVDGALERAWLVDIQPLDADSWYQVVVSAGDGAQLELFDYVSDAAYDVYPVPAEAPSFVSPPPPADGRTLVSDPHDPAASPFGWHDTNGVAGAESTLTTGNNVNAYADRDGNNLPDSGSQPNGGASLVFQPSLDLTQSPITYRDAAVVNLFYMNNVLHDALYAYGFDEASGNFQVNNYGNGGSGGDPVQAEAQDKADTGSRNNANFATPPDGSDPRMQMFLWSTASPELDGDFDNGIISHEYGHGLSNRLVGGPSTTSCLNNTEQMGEGWSDYVALMLSIEPGDAGPDGRGIGTYALNQGTTGAGIRAFRYSTNFGIDPRTYDEIKTASVPHGVGSTWTAMLWEMTWELVDAYGLDTDLVHGTGGNNVAFQLVVDGLKLTPCSPGFVDGRDAILAADQLTNGGANVCRIWDAFARRGLGESASQGSSASRTDGTEAFDIPSECEGLSLTKTAPASAPAGSTITFDLTVLANGTPQNGVVITDPLPANVTFVAGSGTCPTSTSGSTVTITIGNLAAGATANCSFDVVVDGAPWTTLLLQDDFESGATNWTTTHASGSVDWALATTASNSGATSMFVVDSSSTSDVFLQTAAPLSVDGTTELSFWHTYGFETNWDGGVVEISLDSGSTWSDLGSHITSNGYDLTLSSTGTNPIAGRPAFSGSSGGWIQTTVDLAAYAGSSALLRFRVGTDSSIGSQGWWVDDVTIGSLVSVTNTATAQSTTLTTQSTSQTVITEPSGSGLCAGLPVTVDIGQGDVPTTGSDVILGTSGDDVIYALSGDDVICAGDGDDFVAGADGNDVMYGEAGDDTLTGNAGDDIADGGAGADTVWGGSGSDTLDGGAGADTVGGGSDNDTVDGSNGADVINGGSGSDTVRGGSGNDRVSGGGGDDAFVRGGTGDDIIGGNGGNDTLYGDDDNDSLYGGPADDILYGGAGNDFLGGNDGIDICDGQAGTDTAAGNCETVIGVP